jgi:hypothetical protein
MKPNRKTLLFLALAVVVGLAVFAPPSDGPVEPTTVSNSRNAKGADTPVPARAPAKKDNVSDNSGRRVLNEYPERGILGKSGSDLFGTQSWLPPPPPPSPPPKVVIQPPPPPPVPQPPAMTFRFAGRFIQDGKHQVYVSNGDTPMAVKVGDNLDGYVVEAVTVNSVALVYPPLGHKMFIAIPPDFVVDGSTPAVPFVAPPRVPAAASVPGAFPLPGMLPQQGNSGPPVPKPANGSARVKWDGPARIKMGINFSLTLRAEADQPISGSAIQVRYDPIALESVAVQPGKLYAVENGRGFTHRINADGTILISANRKSAAATGDNELLILTFKPRKPGLPVEVSLAALNIVGTAGRTVTHDTLASYRATVVR